MFFRTSIACRSTSAIARAPSSADKRWRLDRSIAAGDGTADFLALILHPFRDRQNPLDPGIERVA
jgi:hypothetical protein